MAQKGKSKNAKKSRGSDTELLEANRIARSFVSAEHIGYPKRDHKGVLRDAVDAEEHTRRLRPHVRAVVLDPPVVIRTVRTVVEPSDDVKAERRARAEEERPKRRACPRCRMSFGYNGQGNCNYCGVHRDRPVRAA